MTMKKYLITGIGGFVGRYFWEYLLIHEPDVQVLGLDMMQKSPWNHPALQYEALNLMDASAIGKVVESFRPDCIIHLASMSSVGQSWKAPAECFNNNTGIFLNLIEAVRCFCPTARVLSIGSSEEYGDYPSEAMPLNENYELHPGNPYAVARVAQEMLSKLYARSYDLDIMMTRSFNHIGPGQREVFVISSFIKQLVSIKKHGVHGKLHVGNINITRDFLDVRDVVDAYWKIINHGKKGEIYNVCSGNGVTLKNIIDKLCNILELHIDIVIDESLIRPTDNLHVIGDNYKLCHNLGWNRKYSMNDTLKDMIDYWRNV